MATSVDMGGVYVRLQPLNGILRLLKPTRPYRMAAAP